MFLGHKTVLDSHLQNDNKTHKKSSFHAVKDLKTRTSDKQ